MNGVKVRKKDDGKELFIKNVERKTLQCLKEMGDETLTYEAFVGSREIIEIKLKDVELVDI